MPGNLDNMTAPFTGRTSYNVKDIDAIKDIDKEILLTSNKESYQDGKERSKERYERLRDIKRREDNRNK